MLNVNLTWIEPSSNQGAPYQVYIMMMTMNYSEPTDMSRHCEAPFTRYNLLSNRFDNWLHRVYKHSTGCQTRFYNQLYRVYEHSAGCQTGLTTGWMFVYTIQPVVKPVVQPFWQPVVSCKRGIRNHIHLMRLPTSRPSWSIKQVWSYPTSAKNHMGPPSATGNLLELLLCGFYRTTPC